jgi:hypothetical protein
MADAAVRRKEKCFEWIENIEQIREIHHKEMGRDSHQKFRLSWKPVAALRGKKMNNIRLSQVTDVLWPGKMHIGIPSLCSVYGNSKPRAPIEKVARVSGLIDANRRSLQNKFVAVIRSVVMGRPAK